ncbi:MAG: hypothetical protein COU11_02845 [Candidatus Harrisonbacteria bacterium CG10_big_fil_rev_8_21_14_0_10_49_15]|uniref:Cytotoxin n=1 Tax=Candidatus Harrisonbacteria bacterium CG10_big_fil_rev_8_21_14_0_10_49_15 TaxID=1974587 RepID=A0A2H0UKJ4_9BACT|nr:MAG: hypothetical protein COU11_02845 [Candidatus Harrisonbacteria bacterium CG10_big_fil_rev_8_21_14_0_10_49_15]
MYAKPVKIFFDKDFEKDVKRLPKKIQNKLADLLTVAQKNIFDPRLHVKSLKSPLSDFLSFRITRDYRVGFMFTPREDIQLLVADKRDKIYKRLARK